MKFDAFGSHGLSHQLKACWVTQRCASERLVGVDAICQPKEVPTLQTIYISGSFEMSVASSTALMTDPNAESALKQALASVLEGVTEDMIRIDGMSTSRRLRSSASHGTPSSSLRSLQEAVTVSYTILASEDIAGAVSDELVASQTSSLASAVNTALDSAGISAGSATISQMSTPSSVVKDSEALQQSRNELAAIQSLLDVVQKHLDETISVLNATKQQLENKTLTGNSTHEELAALLAKHDTAAQELSQLMASHNTMQDNLQNASIVHNQTHLELEKALADKTLATREMEAAQSDLASAQQALAAAQVDNTVTQEKLDEALKKHNLTLSQLEALSSTHSAVAKELEELNANHTKALEQLTSITSVRDAKQVSTEAAAEAQSAAEKRLAEALEKNQESQENLRAAALREQSLDADLKKVMDSLSLLQSAHTSTQAELRRTKTTLAELLSTHALTMQALDEEKQKHQKTMDELERAKQELDDEEQLPSRGILLGIVCGLLAFGILFGVFSCYAYRYRKDWLLSMLHMNRPDAGAGDVVVVGRPLGHGQAADHGGAGSIEKGEGQCSPTKDDPNCSWPARRPELHTGKGGNVVTGVTGRAPPSEDSMSNDGGSQYGSRGRPAYPVVPRFQGDL